MRPFNTPFILWPSAGRRPKNVPFIPAFQASLTEPRPQRVVSVPSTATLTGSRQGRGMQTRTGTRCSQNICACGVSLTFSQHLWVSAFHIILFWSGKFSCGEQPAWFSISSCVYWAGLKSTWNNKHNTCSWSYCDGTSVYIVPKIKTCLIFNDSDTATGCL